MKELLYTKYRLDYACFRIENNEMKQTDASDFSTLENKLISTQELNLPFSEEANGTYGIYYDTVSHKIKRAVWNYSTENDIRGYVEARFTEENISPESVKLTLQTAERLEEMLKISYERFSRSPSEVIRFRLDGMPSETHDKYRLFAFIRLYFMLLPSGLADNVIFINQYWDIPEKFPDFSEPENPAQSISFDSLDSWLMELLYTSRNYFEYSVILKVIFSEYSGYDTGMLSDISGINSDMKILWEFQMIFSFIDTVNGNISETYYNKVYDIIMDYIILEINKLYSERNFSVQLENYKEAMKIFRQEKFSVVYRKVREKLYFRNMHMKKDDMTYIREGFRVLSTLGGEITPQDREYYSDLCFSYVKNARTGRELESLVTDISGVSISEFFSIVKAEKTQLCNTIVQNALDELRNYNGCGHDDEAVTLRYELDIAIEISDSDFRNYMLVNYAEECRNIMQLESLTKYFLDENTSFSGLLEFLDRCRIEDMYINTDLNIFEVIISAANKALPENEASAMYEFLRQYRDFLGDSGNIAESQDADAEITSLYGRYSGLIDSQANAYNSCRSEQGKRIFAFVCRNITGNPLRVLLMMYFYSRKFTGGKKKFRYKYYSQFYELMFSSLLNEESLENIKYTAYMFGKNELNFRSPLGRFLRKISRLSGKGKKHGLISTENNESESFAELLTDKLSGRYEADARGRELINNEITGINSGYMRFIGTSRLKKYYRAYLPMFRKYMCGLIEKF